MITYIDFLPEELISLTFKCLDKYFDIISYASFLLKTHKNISIFFENMFISMYPMLYQDIKNVIEDDIYLNKNVNNLPNWTVLYAILIQFYNIIDLDKKILSIDNLISQPQYAESLTIIYRALVNKQYHEIYNKIKVYESFNFESFEKHIFKTYNYVQCILYGVYGLDWNILYNLLIKSTNKYMEIGKLYDNLLGQDNMIDIIKVLISYPEIVEYIINYTPIEYIAGLITYGADFNKKSDELFKFIYLHKIGPTQEYTWEYLLIVIEQDNFEMFKWLLENGEKTWINNLEFDVRYNDIKNETEENFKMYDELFELYQNN